MNMARRLPGAVLWHCVLAASVLSLIPATTRATEDKASRRPNILFILTDDQRWDTMGCAGNKVIQTPHMDALAKGGVRFRNAFATTPICAASRASILTGLYERSHRFTFGTPPLADRHADLSYPILLKMAGYRVGFVGKFGVNVDKGTTARLFDYFVPLNRNPYFKKQPDGSERHLTDIEADKAVAFFDTIKPGEPFCLSVSFNAPHAEDNDPRQYIWQKACDELYKNAEFAIPKTMTEEFFAAHPEFLRKSESRVRFNWRFNEPAKYQEMVKGYYRMITGVDMAIGRIVAELKKRGLADNTVIILTSDNGYFLGERGFADKWYIYEYSVRVPLIVHDGRHQKLPPTPLVDVMALNVDLAPTMLELAGVQAPRQMQGRSLVPLLQGTTPTDWRKDFFFEHLFERHNIPRSEGVRTERWSYVRWLDQNATVEELYDHQADFDQVRNLVADASHSRILETLRRRTDELRDAYGGAVPKYTPKKGGKKK
jgi:arylsulfatase A-like enzyme